MMDPRLVLDEFEKLGYGPLTAIKGPHLWPSTLYIIVRPLFWV